MDGLVSMVCLPTVNWRKRVEEVYEEVHLYLYSYLHLYLCFEFVYVFVLKDGLTCTNGLSTNC